ncbi:MAG: outer membrane beta-barrel protein [Bacteroidota bacterium]
MRPKSSSLEIKSSLLLILLLISSVGFSQRRGPRNRLETFLDTQFWLGIKLGINYTQASPDGRNTGFSPIDYSADSLRKSYDDFALPGAHVGLEMNFYHRGFSASFQPAFKRGRYKYNSMLEWTGLNSQFQTVYNVEQRLDLIEFPLLLKYDVIQRGKIRPFVMVGGFHSIVISAQKDVKLDQVDLSTGTPLGSSGGIATLGVKEAFQNFSGLSGGIGLNLDYWNIRTVFEINYKHSLTSATRPNAQQNELASLGEVNDELLLRDLNISLSFVFPFRFIDQQFKAL